MAIFQYGGAGDSSSTENPGDLNNWIKRRFVFSDIVSFNSRVGPLQAINGGGGTLLDQNPDVGPQLGAMKIQGGTTGQYFSFGTGANGMSMDDGLEVAMGLRVCCVTPPASAGNDYQFFFGLNDSVTGVVTTDHAGIGLYSGTSEVNWTTVNKGSGSAIATDTGTAINTTGIQTLELFKKGDGTQIDFYIDGSLEKSETTAANLPGGNFGFLIACLNVANAAEGVFIFDGYIAYKASTGGTFASWPPSY